MNYIHHIALTVSDLAQAEDFYTRRLGQPLIAKHAPNYVLRASGDSAPRIAINFFEVQLTLILAPVKLPPATAFNEPHFGIIFRNRTEFDEIRTRVEREKISFFTESPTRYHIGTLREQENFFIMDPFYNVIQFKHYAHIDEVPHWSIL